jgi:Rad52/22 family double-strand break repair protein
MGFSAKQVKALRRNLDHRCVRTREVNGRELSYIEGWYAISEANRIFGFDGWSRETVKSRCVLARENRGAFVAVYTARVRISVQAGSATIIREGHGSGEGRGASPGEVHDTALKAAETDATKRALATFGRPFGLALYGVGKSPSIQPTMPSPSDQAEPVQRFGFHPDDTTPIPRPSRYYGRRQYAPLMEQLRKASADHKQTSSAPPLSREGSIQIQIGLTRANSRLPNPNGCVTRHISSLWRRSRVLSADDSRATHIIFGLRNRVALA